MNSWDIYGTTVIEQHVKEQAEAMGCINNIGAGFGCVPKGYYLSMGANGTCSLFISIQKENETVGIKLTAVVVPDFSADKWHNLNSSSLAITSAVLWMA